MGAASYYMAHAFVENRCMCYDKWLVCLYLSIDFVQSDFYDAPPRSLPFFHFSSTNGLLHRRAKDAGAGQCPKDLSSGFARGILTSIKQNANLLNNFSLCIFFCSSSRIPFTTSSTPGSAATPKQRPWPRTPRRASAKKLRSSSAPAWRRSPPPTARLCRTCRRCRFRRRRLSPTLAPCRCRRRRRRHFHHHMAGSEQRRRLPRLRSRRGSPSALPPRTTGAACPARSASESAPPRATPRRRRWRRSGLLRAAAVAPSPAAHVRS